MTADDEPEAGDIIEQGDGSRRSGWFRWLDVRERGAGGTGWRPSRGTAVLATVTLFAGLAAGYAAGKGSGGGSAAPSPSVSVRASPGSPVADVGLAVEQGMAWCSMQFGTNLQLGIEVTNQSGTGVILTGVRPVLPAGKKSLSDVSWQWGPCAANTYGPSQSAVALAPGATAWLSVTLTVHVRCPGPYPVEFRVSYVSGAGDATAVLSGFPDLSQVRYSGCSPSAGSAGTSSSTFSAIFLGPAGTVHTLHRGLHDQDAADVLAVVHVLVTLVDVLERVAAGDHAV